MQSIRLDLGYGSATICSRRRPAGHLVALAVEDPARLGTRRNRGRRDRHRAHPAAAKSMSVDAPARKQAAIADPEAREFLRKADPVLAPLIDARPDFRPRAWMDELPPLDAFATLIFQVAGQQLSVSSTRAIISHLQERFGGHLPSPAELLAADPQVLRDSGFSARKGQTLRALAERFVDGRLSDEALSRMTDEEVEATLTEVPGIGLWSARGFLLVALDRPDVFLSGDLALRRAIQRVYGFDHVPTDDEVAEVSDRWRPYRSLAVSYLFASEYDGQT
jgi:DNA-3-methyladenine glycosylase II